MEYKTQANRKARGDYRERKGGIGGYLPCVMSGLPTLLYLLPPHAVLKSTKYDKVVRREVCRVTTKGTRVYSFIDGDTTEAQAAFLLAIAEKVFI